MDIANEFSCYKQTNNTLSGDEKSPLLIYKTKFQNELTDIQRTQHNLGILRKWRLIEVAIAQAIWYNEIIK